MNSSASSYSYYLKRTIAMLSGALLLSGCALEMRCDPVAERVSMHDGQWWAMESETDDQTSTSETFTQFAASENSPAGAPPQGLPPEVCGDDTYKSAFRAKRAEVARAAKSRAAAVGISLPAATDLLINEQKAPPEPRAAEQPGAAAMNDGKCLSLMEQSAGQPQASGVSVDSEAARQKYLYNRKIFLTPRKLSSDDGALAVPLHLLNNGLNCQEGQKSATFWRCNAMDDLPLSFPDNSTLAACMKTFDNTLADRAVNFLGAVDDRYCVLVSVIEQKLFVDQFQRSPSNVNRDFLRVIFSCVTGDQTPPGGVVGGPKPNFISPIKGVSDK
jgi:hypothetical protein